MSNSNIKQIIRDKAEFKNGDILTLGYVDTATKETFYESFWIPADGTEQIRLTRRRKDMLRLETLKIRAALQGIKIRPIMVNY